MLEGFFKKETAGVLKGITPEWQCPHGTRKNSRILTKNERAMDIDPAASTAGHVIA